MEIKGRGEQVLVFLWILGTKSVSIAMQAIIQEGVRHYCSHWMYAWTSHLRVKSGNNGTFRWQQLIIMMILLLHMRFWTTTEPTFYGWWEWFWFWGILIILIDRKHFKNRQANTSEVNLDLYNGNEFQGKILTLTYLLAWLIRNFLW